MEKKIICYYRKSQYGVEREYVASKNEAELIHQLTGQKTINPCVRFLIENLSDHKIIFQEELAP